MTREPVSYEWTCPICGESRVGLAVQDRASVEGQARNALIEHVQTATGGGHGDDQEFPPGFDSADAMEHIEFRRSFHESIDELR